MIQDDFGTLMHTPSSASIAKRLDAGDARMKRIEDDLADNTKATQATAESTLELVAILQALKGAFRVLEYIGKLVKPLGYIFKAGLAVAAIWSAIKTGGQSPR